MGIKRIAALVVVVAFGARAAVHARQAASAGARTTPVTQEAHKPRNVAELDEMFRQVANWGRWGKDDQLGAANLVTDAKRRQAAALVKTGTAVSLARDSWKEVAPDNQAPFEHVVNRSASTMADSYKFSYHGYTHSHIDALCHILYKGQTYNGYAGSEVTSDKGCLKLGIENLKNGVVTRGVLIDIPRLRNIPFLEPGTPVYVEDIEAWEKMAGVKLAAGDALLLRTGRFAPGQKSRETSKMSGLHASVVPWIKARGIAFVGSDGIQDVVPTLIEGVTRSPFPLHMLLITALGINLLDNQNVEDLAVTAARLKRWEFMLTIAPIAVPWGSGGPVNALATF